MYKDIVLKCGKEFSYYTNAVLVQGDTNAYRIILDTPWELEGYVFKVTCRRPDDVIVTDTGEVQGNAAMYVMANSMYSVPGDVTFQLTLCGGDETVLTPCELSAYVAKGNGEGTIAENTVPILDKLISRVTNIEDEIPSNLKNGSGADSVQSQSSQALSEGSAAIGTNCKAGSMAFSIIEYDDDGKAYTLDSTEGLEVGDVYSINLKNQYDNVGSITAIDGNKVTVDVYKPTESGSKNIFRIGLKPQCGTIEYSKSCVALGDNTIASGDKAYAEGRDTKAIASYSHAEGRLSEANAYASHVEGDRSEASGSYAHSEGSSTKASGNASHSEGYLTSASGVASHAEGQGGHAYTDYSHIEGLQCYTRDTYYEGYKRTVLESMGNHSEGGYTMSCGMFSHSEGIYTEAIGDNAHAEGNKTIAVKNAHSEGSVSKASGECSHAEGGMTTALGKYSHTENYYNKASGFGSHAEGYGTSVTGDYSHSEGLYTIASSTRQHVQGKYNIEDANGKYAHIVGNGNETQHSNCHTLDWQGNAWFSGNIEAKGIILNSTTPGSTARYLLTVSDGGNLVIGLYDGTPAEVEAPDIDKNEIED